MKKHNKEIRPQKLSRRKLTHQEYLAYEQIGMVDETQDWLELFTPARVNDLFVIMKGCSDNQVKADAVEAELKELGFNVLGEGTNILTLENKMYPGVVFKVALDDNGLADNYNDAVLEEMVNEFLPKPRFTHVLAKHPSGIVSVQERKVPIYDQDRMDSFRPSIMKALAALATKFLIVDLSPSEFHLNYGVERNGDWCFIDASDLYPLANLPEKIRCRKAVQYDEKRHKVMRCGGKLRYTPDFSRVYCPTCNGVFMPSEIRPKDKEDKMVIYSDGLSREEREAMRQKQMVRVGGKVREITVDIPDKPAVPTTDNPETVAIRNETTSQFLGRFQKPTPKAEPVKKEEPTPIKDLFTSVPTKGPDEIMDYSPDDLDDSTEIEAGREEVVNETTDIEETAVEADTEQEEEEVARSGIQEPAPEAVADLEPVSENPVPVDDDDEDDEDDDVVESSHFFDGTVKDPESEDDEDAEIPDSMKLPEELEESVDEEDDDDYSIIYTINQDPDDPNYGIVMSFTGDPMKALEEKALPIFIRLGEHDYAQAINHQQMVNLIRPVLQDMLDDMGL